MAALELTITVDAIEGTDAIHYTIPELGIVRAWARNRSELDAWLVRWNKRQENIHRMRRMQEARKSELAAKRLNK